MSKSTPWSNVLPPVAIVLAVALAATAAWLWLGGPAGAAGSGPGVGAILVRAEAPEAEHLVHDQPSRHVAARDDENTRLALRGGAAGAEERLQIHDGEQLAAEVRDPAQPRLRARDARDLLRHREHLANVAARGDEALGTEPEPDADPFVGRRRRAFARCDRGARAPLQFQQQLERPVCEGL